MDSDPYATEVTVYAEELFADADYVTPITEYVSFAPPAPETLSSNEDPS